MYSKYNIVQLTVLVFATILIAEAYCNCPPYKPYPVDYLLCKFFGSTYYPVRRTSHGDIGGKCSYNKISGTIVCDYIGVGYAKPPTGFRRFKAPQELADWSGINWALKYKPCCVQMLKQSFIESEDCLYMNVHVPIKCTPNNPCSVVLWIHGGGFMFGCGNLYRPDHFVNNGVVFVSINYRLGALGFLNCRNDNCPGNQGLLDQTEALKWINENIQKFGGDPKSVSIFGQSAGAASSCLHCMSEQSKGLFRRCEMQSGNCLVPWAVMENDQDIFNNFMKYLGQQTNSTPSSVESLQYQPLPDIVKSTSTVFYQMTNIQQITVWGPTLDHNKPPFLIDTPRNILRYRLTNNKSSCHDADLLIGKNIDDGAFLKTILDPSQAILTAISANHEILTPVKCNFVSGSPESKAAGNTVFNKYFSDGVTELSLYKYGTCSLFVDGIYELCRLNILRGKKCYLYTYKLRGPRASYIRNFLLGNGVISQSIGPVHGDELYTLFPGNTQGVNGMIEAISGANQFPPVPEPNQVEKRSTERFVEALTDFTKTGNPTSKWQPVNDLSNIKSYILDVEDSLEADPHAADMVFWSKICPI